MHASRMSQRFFIHAELHGTVGVNLNELLRRLATSMVGLFIPIYIWQETKTLDVVPLYFLVFSLVAFLSNYPGAVIIKIIGIDRGMALGSMFRALFLYSLIFASSNHTYFYISAVFFGLAQPFDWLPYYYVISKRSPQHHFGTAVSISKLVTKLGTALGPVVGGLVIHFLGFSWLYLLAGTLILVAALMPFLDDFEKSGMHVNGAEVLARLADPGIVKHILVNGLLSADILFNWIIWPLFLFFSVRSYASSGFLQTGALLASVGAIYITGRLINRKQFKVMTLGSILTSLGWLGILIFSETQGLFAANTVYHIGIIFLWLPVWACLYTQSVCKKYTLEYWLVHEILCFGLQTAIAIGIVFAFWLAIPLKTLMMVAVVFSVLTLGIRYWYREFLTGTHLYGKR